MRGRRPVAAPGSRTVAAPPSPGPERPTWHDRTMSLPSSPEPADVLAVVQAVADEVLLPAAMATEDAALVPVELLDALAHAGLYGIAGPADAGGLALPMEHAGASIEILAGACLTTAFVW